MRDDADLQPELAEVLQEQPGEDYAAVDVCVRDIHTPVFVQDLPRNGGMSAFTKTIAAAAVEPRLILTADRWRGEAKLVAVDADMQVCFDNANQPTATWPQGVPLVLRGIADVYVQGVGGAAVTVSVIVERWAAGSGE